MNLGDITKIDLAKLKELGNIDLITHGSPCQDFSIAGRLAGGDKGSGTRSSLMWCTVDIVEVVKPKYVMWENVKNLLSAKNRHNFDGYLEIMDKLGYNSYYKVLNAKNYGIPQNRERVFTVSIRKDIDKGYEFPEEIELTKKLKDILEKDVDEKYYLSDKLIAGLIANTEHQKAKGNGFTFETTDGDCVAKTITTKAGQRMTDNFIQVVGKLDIKGHDCVKRIYSKEGIAPTLTDMQGGNRQPKIMIVGNYMPSGHDASRIVDEKGIAPTVKENHETVTATIIKPKLINNDKRLKRLVEKTEFKEGKVLNLDLYNQTTNEDISQCLTEPHHNTQRLFDGYRIRKLTPKECWRLMGFDDEDFEKAKAIPTSNTQLYKQAGNSIVVNVLEAVFKNLFRR